MEINRLEKYFKEAINQCSSDKFCDEIEKIRSLIYEERFNEANYECFDLLQQLFQSKNMESYIELNKVKNKLNEILKN